MEGSNNCNHSNCIYFFRGSAISKIIGANAARLDNFEDRVTMYVYEEIINGRKLTEIINEEHENVKYLPGHKIPENVVSLFLYIYKYMYICNVILSVSLISLRNIIKYF